MVWPCTVHNFKFTESRPQGYKTIFSCSTQLSMKFSLLINMKMPTIVGIFIFISREIFMLSQLCLARTDLLLLVN